MNYFISKKSYVSFSVIRDDEFGFAAICIDKIFGKEKKITIPETINGLTVYKINNYAMAKNKIVEEIKFGENIEEIGERSFLCCSKLTSIIFPENLHKIDFQAFYGCTSLNEISLPENLISIEMDAFKYCTKLEKINMPKELLYIDDGVFKETAYERNKKNWEDGILYLGNYLIETDCDNVPENYQVKQNTVAIAAHAFKDCVNVERVILPDGMMNIGYKAFENCISIKYVNIPSTIKEFNYDIY